MAWLVLVSVRQGEGRSGLSLSLSWWYLGPAQTIVALVPLRKKWMGFVSTWAVHSLATKRMESRGITVADGVLLAGKRGERRR